MLRPAPPPPPGHARLHARGDRAECGAAAASLHARRLRRRARLAIVPPRRHPGLAPRVRAVRRAAQ
eukprot:1149771-Alexandrium_andersonii.AAC.1